MALQLLNPSATIDVIDADLGGDVTNGDKDTVYTVRQILPSVSRQLTQPFMKHRPNPKSRVMEPFVPDEDQMGVLDAHVDYALVAWSGIQDNGVDVPCTTAYKALLDFPRKQALLMVAGLNHVAKADAKQASFREPAPVV